MKMKIKSDYRIAASLGQPTTVITKKLFSSWRYRVGRAKPFNFRHRRRLTSALTRIWLKWQKKWWKRFKQNIKGSRELFKKKNIVLYRVLWLNNRNLFCREKNDRKLYKWTLWISFRVDDLMSWEILMMKFEFLFWAASQPRQPLGLALRRGSRFKFRLWRVPSSRSTGIRELMLPCKMTIYSETLRKKLMKMFRGKQNRRQTEFSSENLIVLVFCVFLRRNRKKSSIKGQKKSFFSAQNEGDERKSVWC